jgi:hypothetical protein
MTVRVYRSGSLMKLGMRNAVYNTAAWSNVQGAPRRAEILWEVHIIWQDIMWCQQYTRTWAQFRHQVPGQHSGPYAYFKQIQCYQHPTRNFKNATVKDGLTHQVHFVRWPCAMWCDAVWQMCTVLWDDPVRCDVMQYGRCVQMFCENMLQGGSGSLFKIQVFWTVLHYIFSNTSEKLTAIRLFLTHWDWDIISSRNTHSYPPRYTASLYIYSECYYEWAA